MIESNMIPVEGGSLQTTAEGSGVPVVFVHAGIANMTMWDEQAGPFVEAGFRVIRYDLRRFGRSRSESVPFSNRRDLAAVLDYYAVKQAHLVGCSIGGNIIVDFALEFPDRVLSLVPVCAGIGGAPFEDAPNELPKFDAMEAAEAAGDWDKLAQLDVEIFVEGFYRGVDKSSRALQERVLKMARANYGRDDGKPQPIPLQPPAYERLAQIKSPTLVVIGALDTKATVDMAGILAVGVPGAHKLVISATAHLPSMEQPDLFNREVITFLKHSSS